MVRTRFAPSPTGDLHVGGAWTALASWALARGARGASGTVLRVEDIDTPRVVAGAAARIADDLAWLGFDWSEGAWGAAGGDHAPYIQSERTRIYDDALAKLAAAGLTYPCDCSRAEISRVASAPHAGDEIVYPGTCRDAPRDREMKRPPAIRLRVPKGSTIAFDDLVCGRVEQHVDVAVGDFVLRRGDGIYAYQLVVAVDDAAMEISHVVRADDLLASTARQILLMRLLGFTTAPSYAHVPMVVAPDGDRLAKRAGAASIRDLRARGVSAEAIVGTLGHALGLVRGDLRPMTAREVAASIAPPSAWRREPWPIPAAWA
ncbi:MAG: tRNA glutamyl-Q(34) synthetase GluQRS [Labilithrix sp.]|nr:tRNA glutamyl-Q(34) synthetase GluQRS [Labilithrix sp.]